MKDFDEVQKEITPKNYVISDEQNLVGLFKVRECSPFNAKQ